MEKLGLIVDSLQIQEIEDPSGYIQNLAAPHTASVQREARIAQAASDREASTAEQGADAQKALARRDSLIKQAGYQAEIDQAVVQAHITSQAEQPAAVQADIGHGHHQVTPADFARAAAAVHLHAHIDAAEAPGHAEGQQEIVQEAAHAPGLLAALLEELGDEGVEADAGPGHEPAAIAAAHVGEARGRLQQC